MPPATTTSCSGRSKPPTKRFIGSVCPPTNKPVAPLETTGAGGPHYRRLHDPSPFEIRFLAQLHGIEDGPGRHAGRRVLLGLADHGRRASCEQATQIAITSLADTAELFLAGVLLSARVQSRPRNLAPTGKLGSATPATKAVAGARPTPGISSSSLLVLLERCHALIILSNSKICALSIRS